MQYLKKHTDPELYNFIVFHNLLDKVINNVKMEIDTDPQMEIKDDDQYTAIIQLFYWESTPEGHDFWANYHYLFEEEKRKKFKFLKDYV